MLVLGAGHIDLAVRSHERLVTRTDQVADFLDGRRAFRDQAQQIPKYGLFPGELFAGYFFPRQQVGKRGRRADVATLIQCNPGRSCLGQNSLLLFVRMPLPPLASDQSNQQPGRDVNNNHGVPSGN